MLDLFSYQKIRIIQRNSNSEKFKTYSLLEENFEENQTLCMYLYGSGIYRHNLFRVR